jgi:N-acetylglucosamine kinase-like BadF-type ATPase
MLDLKILGKRIRELRMQSKLTQSAFAENMYVSFQAVSNWERGIAPPDLENLMAIAEYFGVSVDSLLRPVNTDLFIGIDGGGTKTEFALVTKDGYIEKRILTGGCNPNDVGFERMCEIIIGGISEITAEFPSVRSVFCGIAGISVGDNAKRLSGELKKHFPTIHTEVKNDAFNLFATAEDVDIALISGTGSVAFVRTENGYARIGGWGYLFDDAGSGFGIGKDAIRRALEEEDKRMPSSVLSSILREKLGTDTVFEHLSTVYKKGKPYIAKLSSVVFEAYEKNDSYAIEIIDNNAKALANLLNTGIDLYGARPRAVASGGIFERYKDIIIPHIKKYTDAELTITDLAPVSGACRAAVSGYGAEINETFFANFKRTYGENDK